MKSPFLKLAAFLLVIALVGFMAYLPFRSRSAHNPYVDSSPQERAGFKRIAMPLPQGTHFTLSQGAFGRFTHHEAGLEYRWDFDVPYGTPIVAVADGKVIEANRPPEMGGCSEKFINSIGIVHLLLNDGTIAQYGHVVGSVTVGTVVKKGQILGHTANNGFHCTPQLCFCVFKDRNHSFGYPGAANIPVLFSGLPEDGLAREGISGTVN